VTTLHYWCPECQKKIVSSSYAAYCRTCGSRTCLKFDKDNLLTTTRGQQFRILECLSQHPGTNISTVYLAEQIEFERRVVLKVTCSEDNLSFLEQEFYLLTKLSHRYIIKLAYEDILSSFVEGNLIWFIVLEYMPERSLEYRLRQGKALSIEQTIDLVLQICEALAYVHNQGYIHFDIKPSNILLKTLDHAILSDFDVAQHQSVVKNLDNPQVGLTLPYAAPELLDEAAVIDHSVDIYALGMSLYEILAERYPLYRSFSDLTYENNDDMLEAKLEAKIKAGHIPRPHELKPQANIAPPLESIIFKAIAKNKEIRYRTVEQFQNDLKHLSVQKPIERSRLVYSVIKKMISSFS
jgi:serine/threonine-protein kinase